MNIIYTALFSAYDTLQEIKLEEGWRAICFTDSDIKSDSWEIVKEPFREKIYRDIKIRPILWLPEHEKSVWMDANLELQIPISELVKGKEGFWLMDHPDRNCIYEEAKRCIELGKDSKETIEKQIRNYLLKSYPHKNGLCATGVLIRDASEKNCLVGEGWWGEVRTHSVRDQLSFNYVARKYDLEFKTFPFLQGFKYHYHVHKQVDMEKRRLEKKRQRKLNKITEGYRKRFLQ